MIVYQSQHTRFCLIKLCCRKELKIQKPCKRENKCIYNSSYLLGMFLLERKKKIQVLVPVARTISAMTASCKLHRRVLSSNSLQELKFLQKEGTVLKTGLWPQR